MVTNSIFSRASCDIWQPLVINCTLCSPLNELIVNWEDGGSDHITQGAGHRRGRSARLQLVCLCSCADVRWRYNVQPRSQVSETPRSFFKFSLLQSLRTRAQQFTLCLTFAWTFPFNIMTRVILACNLLIIKPGALVRQPPFFVFDSFTNIQSIWS